MNLAIAALTLVAAAIGSLRWLRVAQREHYIPGSCSTIQVLWRSTQPPGMRTVVFVSRTFFLVAALSPPAAVFPAVAALIDPIGLGLRGRTSKVVFTRRLRLVVAVTGFLAIDLVGLGLVLDAVLSIERISFTVLAAALVAGLTPDLVDLALRLLAPVEQRSSQKFVDSATKVLRQVAPRTVAITGSYGKTTTKGYARHLLAATHQVVASPASFNNTAGLSRTMNEHLTPGTEVLIAEMGTYGAGEIRAMCEWVRPEVAVICAIGPVHLERMGTLDNIVTAKSEITETAAVSVLNVDAHGLAAVADRLEAQGKRVVRCSTTDAGAAVFVAAEDTHLVVHVAGVEVGRAVVEAQASNVACAIGILVALDAPLDNLSTRLAGLPTPPNRQSLAVTDAGVTVIDDTFNSNPAGAASALDRLLAVPGEGRRVVVTPGMVELGDVQATENERFAAAVASRADTLVVVGRTNREALVAGARDAVTVATRADAVAWVRANLGAGDAVLYENDLPDHYP